MPEPVPVTICLNMIVRNEAHIVAEALDSVAPFIDSWVIVDTGSDDGTPDFIRGHMADLGILGELYERPWRNFSHNRTEALELARGRADYILVMDADDLLVGTPDLTGLEADVYQLHIRDREPPRSYWRNQLFRAGATVRYHGVVHEAAVCDDVGFTGARLAGDYHIESRRLGSRNLDPRKYERDCALLLAEVQRNPDDLRSMYYLANAYSCLGAFASARRWYARRVELGGWAEEVWMSMTRGAQMMAELGEPWPDVQEAYLAAWQFRPTRAEPLYALARHYRVEQDYQLGYLFARQAAQIPRPDDEMLPLAEDVYGWRAIDEQAICAEWTGREPEAFGLCRQLISRAAVPEEDRQRIASNRDFSAPVMQAAAIAYPHEAVVRLLAGVADRSAAVTVTLLAGPDRAAVEATLNSFLNCCTRLSEVGRFLLVTAGLSVPDQSAVRQRYGFAEFIDCGVDLVQIRSAVESPLWLHLDSGWRFFAPDDYLGRLSAVLDAEPQVAQVGVNFTDARQLIRSCAPESRVRRTPAAGRYVLAGRPSIGPSLFDTARLDRAGGPDGGSLQTATLDEVLCSHHTESGVS